MAKSYGSAGATTLKKGLKNCSPKAADKSTVMPKTSVNSDATRKSVAKATNNIGPREA
jgi:hypothetical protein